MSSMNTTSTLCSPQYLEVIRSSFFCLRDVAEPSLIFVLAGTDFRMGKCQLLPFLARFSKFLALNIIFFNLKV